MKRLINFSAGPSTLPEAVLDKIQNELKNRDTTGMSVMEMSHRSPEFISIFTKTKQALIELFAIPKHYDVLFLQGGASLQFDMVPRNLITTNKSIGFVHTGIWSQKAMEQASRYASIQLLHPKADFNQAPTLDKTDFSTLSYVHYVSNNTIMGTQWHAIPVDHPRLVCDMSSDIGSKPIDVSKYGIIFAGAQKNLGIAGLTIVIIRKDLLTNPDLSIPDLLSYRALASKDSMINTPPTFAIYVCGLMLDWISQQGGLQAMATHNKHKATMLYEAIDQSSLFYNEVDPSFRSLMNVLFTTGDEQLDQRFIQFAKVHGLVNLNGHRSTLKIRASLYNAMTIEGVQALIQCMQAFERQQKMEVNHA